MTRVEKNEYMKAWRLKNLAACRTKEKERSRKRRANGWRDDPVKVKMRNARRKPEDIKADNLRRRLELRNETFAAYGGVCVCCGEREPIFLTIDHIFNDGAKHQKRLGLKSQAGVHIYRALKKEGFPQDRYRLMCYNCNCGRARNGGICPHELLKTSPN